jgi:hypothetical protein
MAKKIYVGNLSFQTTEGDLNNMFSEIGITGKGADRKHSISCRQIALTNRTPCG